MFVRVHNIDGTSYRAGGGGGEKTFLAQDFVDGRDPVSSAGRFAILRVPVHIDNNVISCEFERPNTMMSLAVFKS